MVCCKFNSNAYSRLSQDINVHGFSDFEIQLLKSQMRISGLKLRLYQLLMLLAETWNIHLMRLLPDMKKT